MVARDTRRNTVIRMQSRGRQYALPIHVKLVVDNKEALLAS